MIYTLIIFIAVFSNANTGQCPVAPNGVMGTCFKDCFKDDDCFSRGHKCCSTGCGYMCMDVYTGECPVVPIGPMGSCPSNCTNHDDCLLGQKCCPNWCAYGCLDVNRECPAGSIQDSTNKTVCILCPAGHVPNFDKSRCERCPDDSIKDVTTSLTYCMLCGPGQIPNSDQSDCLHCEGNTISKAGDTACTACPTSHLAIRGNTECMLIRPLTFLTVDQSGRKDDNSEPKHAVDGNNSTCAVTADCVNPNWYGMFIDEMVVTSVTLSNVGAGDVLPLLVTMAGQFSTIEALCNTWYGENGSNPVIDCPANIRGNSIKIKRLTKEGQTRQLRICEILVKGYPADEKGCKIYECDGYIWART